MVFLGGGHHGRADPAKGLLGGQKLLESPQEPAQEGSESVTKCNRLKLRAAAGRSYLTDVADPEVLLRIVQSVPSPKAEPIKLWLAKVGYERI